MEWLIRGCNRRATPQKYTDISELVDLSSHKKETNRHDYRHTHGKTRTDRWFLRAKSLTFCSICTKSAHFPQVKPKNPFQKR